MYSIKNTLQNQKMVSELQAGMLKHAEKDIKIPKHFTFDYIGNHVIITNTKNGKVMSVPLHGYKSALKALSIV